MLSLKQFAPLVIHQYPISAQRSRIILLLFHHHFFTLIVITYYYYYYFPTIPYPPLPIPLVQIKRQNTEKLIQLAANIVLSGLAFVQLFFLVLLLLPLLPLHSLPVRSNRLIRKTLLSPIQKSGSKWLYTRKNTV